VASAWNSRSPWPGSSCDIGWLVSASPAPLRSCLAVNRVGQAHHSAKRSGALHATDSFWFSGTEFPPTSFDFTVNQEYTFPVQPGKGRVMTVFIAQGWMRWPLRCRACKLADYGLTSGSRGTRAINAGAKCPATRSKREAGRVLRSAEGAKQDRADGSSACPGGSPHEPGGVSAQATIPGDMQQTDKSIRVRNAGERLLLGPVQP
jgi:hypothetical protein